MLLLLTQLALAAPTLGQGPQALTVIVTGVPAGMKVEAEREGVGALPLQDPGRGYLEGTFYAPEARSAALRLTAVEAGRQVLYDGLVLLSDREETRVTFAVERDLARTTAVRVPAAPSAAFVPGTDAGLARPIRFGAAVLGLLYVVGLALLRLRGR